MGQKVSPHGLRVGIEELDSSGMQTRKPLPITW